MLYGATDTARGGYRKLEIIHTDLKPENVMLRLPLQPREWRLPPLDACKHYMASAVATAAATNQPLTKNQKKRLKKKFKKRLEAGAIVHPTPIMADGSAGEPAAVQAAHGSTDVDLDAVASADAGSSVRCRACCRRSVSVLLPLFCRCRSVSVVAASCRLLAAAAGWSAAAVTQAAHSRTDVGLPDVPSPLLADKK